MEPNELAEWEAYHSLEPFGSPADDDRSSIVSALLWYANYKGDLPEFFDRDPEETARLKAKAEAAISLEDKFDAFFGPIAVEAVEPPVA
ncbi:phage tail assembly protein T [Sphingomonas sp. Leaf242]|uniref:phage tail assembly protein T n=1 Tax=Sphingomonas sp. Leaf242 TaxID=1736304 RepID=UPI000ADE6D98|nr:hypothetical protein [Sphingomonas sp. Leaf242]